MTLWLMTAMLAVGQPTSLMSDWANPPTSARLRAYWWWLNGNVTKQSITRDLEAMKAKGFGGALICDADGSAQDGNQRAPHGPTFFSPAWRELYRHALAEADRLGLEMSLNIQSGWNLGGPMVAAEDAPKKLVWTERRAVTGSTMPITLARPAARDGFYRDIAVLAWPESYDPRGEVAARITASSGQAGHGAALAGDGDAESFWVSDSTAPGAGPSATRPQWLTVTFDEPMSLSRLTVAGRPGYGPRTAKVQLSDDGQTFRDWRDLELGNTSPTNVTFEPVRARALRLLITAAYDPRYPDQPRNVQVCELALGGPRREQPDWRWPSSAGAVRRGLRNLGQKALMVPLQPFSAPLSTPLFETDEAQPDDQVIAPDKVLDLTDKLSADGRLAWSPADGGWTVLRLGYTLNDHCRVSTCSEGWEGYAIDPFDDGAFRRYWDAVVEPLIADAGPLAGHALRYLHTDSWEVEVANWTPTLRAQFRARRGYDPLPWLPVMTGRILADRAQSNAFLADLRRTMGDLAIDNHYRLFRDGAHRHGLEIHPESGGPHAVPIDAQQCLGYNDAPMSEFWATSWRHRMGDGNRFFVKQPASAAHVNGRRLVLAEGFTTIGPHWQETLWDNLKPSFDKALCEGLNLLTWHAFVCSPAEQGMPGQQYFAGTHLNPNVTWWSRSGPFFDYLNRCQAMLQRGLPAADVLYYYGDHVPNFAQLKASDPAGALPGYDYDVIDQDALLHRLSVRDGRLVLPDGVSYRLLVLPDRPQMALPALRRISELVAAGAAVIGPKPQSAASRLDLVERRDEFAKLTRELWDAGRIGPSRAAREVLAAAGVAPDVELSPASPDLDWIHRRDGDSDIYFVANRATTAASLRATFRVSGRPAQRWDAVSGRQWIAAGEARDGRTTLTLDLPPCGSTFVVFGPLDARVSGPSPTLVPWRPVEGAWQVSFDPRWGGPAEPVAFEALLSWPQRPEPGIRCYSGTATYRRTLDLPDPLPPGRLVLDLGSVRELAEVRLNGRSLGTVWAPPFQVALTGAARPGANALEVDVVNFWYNRVVTDSKLPAEQRLTQTNIRRLENPGLPLMPSGLLGPVQLLRSQP